MEARVNFILNVLGCLFVLIDRKREREICKKNKRGNEWIAYFIGLHSELEHLYLI